MLTLLSLSCTTPPQVIGDAAIKQKNTARIRCPFLNTDNQCHIYDRRPLSCRSFTSSNSLDCKASLADGRKITQDPVYHRIFQAATTALMAAAIHHGAANSQQDFIPGLLQQLGFD